MSRLGAALTRRTAAMTQRVGRVATRPMVEEQSRSDASTRATIADMQETLARLEAANDLVRSELLTTREALIRSIAEASATMEARLERIRALSGSAVDGIDRLRARLAEVRRSASYEAAYTETEPLVSVRIATFNLAETLVDRALASVRAQTYERFEVVVVGDACTDDTEARIKQLGDARIRFVNLPHRGPYPDAPHRWLVAGSPGMNLASELARGQWIAPLDDDDAFAPDHIEVLLAATRAQRAEVAYGNILQHPATADEPDVTLRGFPPTFGQYGFQAAVYHADLRFFTYNTSSWMLDEPGDWNLCRRMLEAGVRFGWVDRIVSEYYPSTLHGPRRA